MTSDVLEERETTTSSLQPRADEGGLRFSRVILIVAAVGLAAFALKQLPDLRRYLKLRSM